MNEVEKSGTGLTRANWVKVSDQLPAQGELVLIAYRFMEDDELTVDMGERDGDQWLYVGGGPLEHGEVFFWAFPPDCPSVPNIANGFQPAGLVELAA